jgi:hypothetical protein
MKASWAQLLALAVALVSASMFAYINFFAPPKKTEVTVVAPAIGTQSPFHLGKPKRTPTDGEIRKVIEYIDQSYGLKDAMSSGTPTVVSLSSSDAEQLVIEYVATSGEIYLSALEVVDLSKPDIQSIYHREGEAFEYYPVTSGEGTATSNYLLVEERTGASGNYLHLSFMEYDGFGKAKDFYTLSDLFNSNLYLLSDKIILEKEHQFFEMVKDKSTVNLVSYDLKGRLGFHVLSYGFQKGRWFVKHNDEVYPLSDQGLSLSIGEEAFLVSDPASENISARVLSEGEDIEYVQGPPAHIRAVREGIGALHFLSEKEGVPEWTLPISVASARK